MSAFVVIAMRKIHVSQPLMRAISRNTTAKYAAGTDVVTNRSMKIP